MAANPISYLEVDAYARLNQVDLTAWEVGLIRRLDDAVLKAATERAAKPSKPSADGQIPVDNPAGIKALFRGFMARKAKQPVAEPSPSLVRPRR